MENGLYPDAARPRYPRRRVLLYSGCVLALVCVSSILAWRSPVPAVTAIPPKPLDHDQLFRDFQRYQAHSTGWKI